MLHEIEVDGLGTMRQLNNFQLHRLKRIADKTNRNLASPAFGLGMTVRQFKSLPADQQKAALDAHNRLNAPEGFSMLDLSKPAPKRLPRRYERVSDATAADIGAELVLVKASLPHGHFRLWVEEKSGISYTQAQRFMRQAREVAA